MHLREIIIFFIGVFDTTNESLIDHMTLELSLEINQKLQAVLEDTLLKNITLKVKNFY